MAARSRSACSDRGRSAMPLRVPAAPRRVNGPSPARAVPAVPRPAIANRRRRSACYARETGWRHGEPPYKQPVEILLVEDNPDDVDLTLEAFKESGSQTVCTSSRTASRRWRSCATRDRYAGAPTAGSDPARPQPAEEDRPRGAGGDQERSRTCARIPVVVLTTSAADADVARCYELAANCYITKPVDLDEFFAVVRTVDRFWRDVGDPAGALIAPRRVRGMTSRFQLTDDGLERRRARGARRRWRSGCGTRAPPSPPSGRAA